MKLLPAILFIIALFIAASLFINLRKRSKQGLNSTDAYKKNKKRFMFVVTALLFILSSFLLKFMGKISILIAAIIFVIFLINSRRL
jgi:hypothetical protein